MDETTLRKLAAEMLDVLDDEIPDPIQRKLVAEAIADALALPEGAGQTALLNALATNSATRRWMRQHGATEDDVRGALPGFTVTQIGLYYVCPQEDEDAVMISVPPQPPLCSVHHIPMVLEQD